MTRSGLDGRAPPRAMTAAGGNGPIRGPRPDHRAAIGVIALAAAAHMVRSRRFHERMITVAIALAALGRIGRENRASAMARLAAWDKRQLERLERKAEAQDRAVKGAGQMARSGAEASGGEDQHGLTISGLSAIHGTHRALLRSTGVTAL